MKMLSTPLGQAGVRLSYPNIPLFYYSRTSETTLVPRAVSLKMLFVSIALSILSSPLPNPVGGFILKPEDLLAAAWPKPWSVAKLLVCSPRFTEVQLLQVKK